MIFGLVLKLEISYRIFVMLVFSTYSLKLLQYSNAINN
jgi:hypothetical protein